MQRPVDYNQSYILLTMVKKSLGYKDIRSVVHWCKENGVCIIHQGNQKIVNRYEFLISYYKPFINHLRANHKNWQELAVNYIEGNVEVLLSYLFNEQTTNQETPRRKRSSSEFLQILKNL